MSGLPSEYYSSGVKKQPVPPAVPLDLRCSGENGRPPTLPSQHGYAVSVSRRCAPPLVPENTAPSTSLPRGSSSSIVSTLKVNNRRRSANSQTASTSAGVGMSRKRSSRDLASLELTPVIPNPAEKLAWVSAEALGCTGPAQQHAVQSPLQVAPDSEAAVAAADVHFSDKSSSNSSSSQHPAAVMVTTVAGEQGASNPVSLPLMLTSVNGMLVPLSSAAAAIIVVNCATTASPPSSQSSNRLCPIAPAPPPVTKQPPSSATASSTASPLSVETEATTLLCSLSAQRRTYRCEEPGCGKMYFKKSHLKVHRRVHTGQTHACTAF